MQTERTINQLKVAAGITIGFGLIGLLGTRPATSAVTQFLIDLIYWPVDGNPAYAETGARLLWAISGGSLVGWGVMLWRVASELYPRSPDLARSLILTSIGCWFVLDSAGSIAAGAPVNALMNVAFLLLFYLPLARRAAPVPQ